MDLDQLRIVVGFKVTADYEALRPADWVRVVAAEGAEGRAEAARYVRRVFGVFDEAALELALRLRDARAERGLETSLAALTVGGPEAGPFLATLQALGFEPARVDPSPAGEDGGLDFAQTATAERVAACTQRLGGEVLLLGSRSGPAGSGLVPFLVAETLGRPCLTQVTEIEPADGERLRVTFTADDGPVRATVTPPCVLAVGDAVVSMLRVPTLKDRLAVRGVPAAELTSADLGAAAPAADGPVLTGLETIERGRAGAVVPGATPADKAGALYEDYLRSRLEQL